MDLDNLGVDAGKISHELIGYLNFSSGAPDPRFLAELNELFGQIEHHRRQGRARPRRGTPAAPAWKGLAALLREAIQRVQGSSEAFRQMEQAQAVVELVFDHVLPGYRQYHRDLLFHQTDETLFGPLFIGRAFEAVLRQGAPWSEVDRIVNDTIGSLNDFLGHRPIAVLQNGRKMRPYAHEWVRPVPLFIRGAGVAAGRYRDLIQRALEVLESADAEVCNQASFHLDWLDELAMDPRSCDFEHPANKRPNYHFGQWDPDQIDNSGRYRRFVLQQVTLDAMLGRVENHGKIPFSEAIFEAGAVLAGTILMASGISGSGPGAHDSNTSLATLLPRIAAYRDAFYERLISQLGGAHGQRLRSEGQRLRQPFGAARQHLNQELARLRADQLQRTHLAQLYAAMGYTDAAVRQSEIVSVAAARIKCQLQRKLTLAHLAIERGELAAAAEAVPEIENLLHRGIECGALVDPWNILGFGGQFSLFPAVENSIHDYRADELIALVGRIFGLYTRLHKETAASGDTALTARLTAAMEALAEWWDRFATVEVGEVEGFSGREACESAQHVAAVLRAWHEAGTAAGDLAFWRGHVERFNTPKAYAIVVESLLEQDDLVAAMALLIQWLSQAEEIPLVEQDFSFHDLALRWMEQLLLDDEPAAASGTAPPADAKAAAAPPPPETALRRWALARKMLDYLEANAEDYWQTPHLDLAAGAVRGQRGEAEDAEEDDEAEEGEESDPLFAAAYEDVTFRDSADDGIEGEMLQGGGQDTDFELALEAERLADRVYFLDTLARLWRLVASSLGAAPGIHGNRQRVLDGWLAQATTNLRQLLELLSAVDHYRIPTPRGTHDSLVEYDQRRGIKEQLLEHLIATCVETADAARSLRAVVEERPAQDEWAAWEEPAQNVLRAVSRGDAAGVRAAWPALIAALAKQPLLYVALAKGGSPRQIVASRSLQRVLRRLLACLPRLGLLEETYRLIQVIQDMERNHAVGPGAITEFDRMFEIGCKGIARALIVSADSWRVRPGAHGGENATEVELVTHLERAVEALLRCWLEHSHRVRLSVLETVADDAHWRTLRRFIENYGDGLFTQKFMSLGNLRAILHQGPDAYLRYLAEEPDAGAGLQLTADLEATLPREEAARWLGVAIESVVENYSTYIDYNSTTTQSDRGDMLYTLLDFLRLLASYNRVAWNLRPVVLMHDVLVRAERNVAADIWRQAVVERTASIADEHLQRLAALCRQYGMRLPSIAERLEERLVRPLTVDRLRALVGPSIEELRGKDSPAAFRQLQQEIELLARAPSGVGFEVPAWLEALEDEAEGIGDEEDEEELGGVTLGVPDVRLSLAEVRRQVKKMMGE